MYMSVLCVCMLKHAWLCPMYVFCCISVYACSALCHHQLNYFASSPIELLLQVFILHVVVSSCTHVLVHIFCDQSAIVWTQRLTVADAVLIKKPQGCYKLTSQSDRTALCIPRCYDGSDGCSICIILTSFCKIMFNCVTF